jgi:hypothetical protein
MWPTGSLDATVKYISPIPISVAFADKRWLHGRGIQLVTRVACYCFGHDWTGWFAVDEESPLGEAEVLWSRGPHPEVEAVWSRGCRRGCGALQMARATSLQIEDGHLKHGNDLHHRFRRSPAGAPEA